MRSVFVLPFLAVATLGLLVPQPAAADVAATLEREAQRRLLDAAAAAGFTDASATLQLVGRNAPPPCAGKLVVEPVDMRHPARMRFAARCDASPAWREEFVLRGELSAEVVVANATVTAGRPIAAAELTLEKRPLATLEGATSMLDAVAGRASRRALRPGQAVDPRWLVEAVLVKRGAAVSIVATNGPVQVTTRGEALAAGRAGDTIDVRNSATGRVIRARVTAGDTVEPAELPVAPTSQPPR